ncbi:hypothetical protein GCM10010151_66100 [Actinoallomurus spadix]|uniref:Uncharacterized protein n=1 Tax=Actinoallomurus spadix TaxID=79912 RepID=A0ABP3HDB6_9ACTN
MIDSLVQAREKVCQPLGVEVVELIDGEAHIVGVFHHSAMKGVRRALGRRDPIGDVPQVGGRLTAVLGVAFGHLDGGELKKDLARSGKAQEAAQETRSGHSRSHQKPAA